MKYVDIKADMDYLADTISKSICEKDVVYIEARAVVHTVKIMKLRIDSLEKDLRRVASEGLRYRMERDIRALALLVTKLLGDSLKTKTEFNKGVSIESYWHDNEPESCDD